MNVQQKKKQKGFTIIEVVLVLAIAGLIFLMVFIALPALQRSQRDTQRKNDLSRAITAVNNYQSNNRGAPPKDQTQWNSLITGYLLAGGDTFTDPNGTDYSFTTGTPPSTFAGDGKLYYTQNATCSGENILTNQGANKIAVQLKLEGGGVACENN
jgi:prepilin-type N-terminal cleavage/methylation domain-containing protein